MDSDGLAKGQTFSSPPQAAESLAKRWHGRVTSQSVFPARGACGHVAASTLHWGRLCTPVRVDTRCHDQGRTQLLATRSASAAARAKNRARTTKR